MARILVIDDDFVHADVIERWLLAEKHIVSLAHSGREGLQALKTERYDLVILDWDMPDMQGIDVLREFRQTDRSTPVILLTAHAGLDAKEEGLDSGANDYVTKPFSLRELSARIRAAFRNKPPQLEMFKPLGTNNDQMLDKYSSAPPAVALQIMIQTCEGLAHAHAAGIIHRDLKPSNVMLKNGADDRFVVKILDFGLARLVDKARLGSKHEEEYLYGSPLYVAPELVKGAASDARSEIYACGCILFELITGEPVVSGATLDDVFNCHTSGCVPTLQQKRPDLGRLPELQTILNTALDKDPGARYQTVAQFKAALLSAVESTRGSQTSPSP